MSEKFVMTLGLDDSNVEPQGMVGQRFKALIQSICGNSEAIDGQPEFSDNDLSVFLTFKSVDKADDIVKELLEMCAECNLEGRDDFPYRFLVAITGGVANTVQVANAQTLLDALREEAKTRARDNLTLTSQVLITEHVFSELPWKHQDFYSPAEEVRKFVVHRRYAADALRCFVISPIGNQGTETRKRADYVFNTYIKPACDGTCYRAIRGDFMTGSKVIDDVMEALQTAPMVVAHLGGSESAWNPNVMFEVGCRLITGLPIVFLRDDNPDVKLPFDILPDRMIDIPCSGADDTSGSEHQTPTKVTTLRKMLNEACGGGWQFPNACATIAVSTVGKKESNRFLEASRELEELFEIKNIAGSKLDPIIKRLMKRMPPSQSKVFGKEQDELIRNMIVGSIIPDLEIHTSEEKLEVPVATFPIVFKDGRFQGRAFLPIVGSYSKLGEILKLRVFYINVTHVTQKTQNGNYVCNLSQCKPLSMEE